MIFPKCSVWLSQVMIALENRLAAKGNMKFVLYLTIFQCVAQVLAVNHILACLLFYVGTITSGDETTGDETTPSPGGHEAAGDCGDEKARSWHIKYGHLGCIAAFRRSRAELDTEHSRAEQS